jgi:hypothetical protein
MRFSPKTCQPSCWGWWPRIKTRASSRWAIVFRMNGHVAKLAVFWLFCIVVGGNSRACVPLDIFIYYPLLYEAPGTYSLSNGPQVASGGPVMEVEGGCGYAWTWSCDSGLNWSLDYVDGSVYAVGDIGAATPGIYAEYAVACNESGSYDWDYGYVVVVPNVTIAPIGRVPPNRSKDVSVTVAPSGIPITLQVVASPWAVGSASVSPTSITDSTNVTVTGGEQTGVLKMDHLTLQAVWYGNVLAAQEFFVCAHPQDFGVDGYGELGGGYYYGVWVEYSWSSDSGTPVDLNECWASENLNNFFEDCPPFYMPGLSGGSAFRMGSGSAVDQHGVNKAYVYNYCDGGACYDQDMLWNCHRCGYGEMYYYNFVDHTVYSATLKIRTGVSGAGIVHYQDLE